MQRQRHGRLRYAKLAVLTEEDLTKRSASTLWLGWNPKHKVIGFSSRGEERGSLYEYTVSFSPAEIVLLAELMVQGAIEEPASSAVGMAAVATLRQLVAQQTKKD